jgi:hypothetical protein
MGLAKTHKGWENEHLATFLLYRIAFVAGPIKVADDVGTDIFCTLYEHELRDGVEILAPRRSIAVQIKSTPDPVNVRPQLEYIARLEVPYYIGVVNQQALSLTLYSARFLPLLLSLRGSHRRLDFVLVDQFDRHFRPGNAKEGYKLLCHRVATLQASDTKETAAAARALIQEDAAESLKAIASRMNNEYVFDIPGGEVEIYTGRDSARTFRESFYKRLAEALLNLAWLLDHKQPVADAEIEVYLAISERLAATVELPSYVLVAREKLLKARGVAT